MLVATTAGANVTFLGAAAFPALTVQADTIRVSVALAATAALVMEGDYTALGSPALVLDAGASVTAGSISLQPSGHGAMAVVTPHALVSTASNLTINSALAVSGADSLTLAASGTLWV